jgi:hypothetical protein
MKFFNLSADRFLRANSTAASVSNRLQEPAREFGNSVWLSPPDSLSRDQLSTNPQCDRPGSNEAECSPLIHASSGDHWDVGKHRLEILDVTVSPDMSAGHDLDEIRTQFPRRNDVGRRESPGNHDDVLLHGERNGVRIKAVAGEELGSRIQAAARGFDIVNAPGPDNHFWRVLYHLCNDFDRFGDSQRDFENGNSTSADRLGGEKSVLRRRHPNGGNDPEFFDPASYVLLIQRTDSLGECAFFDAWTLRESCHKPYVESGQSPRTH